MALSSWRETVSRKNLSRGCLSSLALAAESLEQSFSFQLVEQPFVDILVHVHLKLSSRISLGNHFQDDVQAIMGHARRKGEDRCIKLIGLLHQRSIFLLQPLVGNRQGFLFVRDELEDALAVGLQEALDPVAVFFQVRAASGNNIDGKGGCLERIFSPMREASPVSGGARRVASKDPLEKAMSRLDDGPPASKVTVCLGIFHSLRASAMESS